jgi:hypothetical protein
MAYGGIPQATKSTVIPVPSGGINSTDNLMAMPKEDCIAQFNLIPETYGQTVRDGYREYARLFTSTVTPTEVRTLISYTGSTVGANRLFACTLEGIYNVTAEGSNYSSAAAGAIAWASKTSNAGYCSYVVYTTIADKFIVLCDEVNGLYTYKESTNTWSKIVENATATGVAATVGTIDSRAIIAGTLTTPELTTCLNFAYVMVWKNRLWFVERDKTTAYYGDVGQITGHVTQFNFGNKFMAGGFLNSLHNLTLDGGVGPDDYLVALSSAGDVIAYQGTDPANIATFDILGVWQLGQLPVGRRLVSSAGGDLYILTYSGILSITQLLRGADPGVTPGYITGKITSLIHADMLLKGTQLGWSLVSFPTESMLIVTVPDGTATYAAYAQYVMDTATRAWSRFKGVPMICAVPWQGVLYFGAYHAADKGRVYKYTEGADDVAGTATGTARIGIDVHSFLITAFSAADPAEGGPNMRVHFIKPQFLAKGIPIYQVEPRFDFDVDDTITTLIGSPTPATTTTWADTWGTALWGDPSFEKLSTILGGSGLGKFSAIALTMKSRQPTTLIGFTAMYDTGGLL